MCIFSQSLCSPHSEAFAKTLAYISSCLCELKPFSFTRAHHPNVTLIGQELLRQMFESRAVSKDWLLARKSKVVSDPVKYGHFRLLSHFFLMWACSCVHASFSERPGQSFDLVYDCLWGLCLSLNLMGEASQVTSSKHGAVQGYGMC